MSIVVIALILSGKQKEAAPSVTDLTLCDRNQRELCIVTFGANDPGSMTINFQLPSEDYPVFHVTGLNREISYDYSCHTDEEIPTTVFCTGPRTPLGEYIDLEVHAVGGNTLLAHGKIFMAAIMIWTPDGAASTPSISETAAIPDVTYTPTPFVPQIIITPLTEPAYPNPGQGFATPVQSTGYPNP
jgi:hypothetical protein